MKKHINECLRLPSGRIAGSGISYDNYDDESILSKNTRRTNPIGRIEHSEQLKELQDCPVTIYKLSKEEMDEYLKKLGGLLNVF